MMKALYLTILSLSVILSSCVSNLESISENVYLVKPDNSNPDKKTYLGELINLQSTYTHSPETFQIRLGFVKVKNKGSWIVKSVYANNYGWAFIEKVGFYLDNKIYYEFDSMPDALQLVDYPEGKNNYYEENLYILNQRFCETLCKTKQVSIIFRTRNNGALEGYLEKSDIKKLKNFIEYINSQIVMVGK